MKKRGTIFLVLFIGISAFCYAQSYYNVKELEVNLKIKSEFEIRRESRDSSIKYIIANLSFFPRENFRQEIKGMKIVPQTEIGKNGIPFRWDKPEFGKYEFKVDSDIKLKNIRNKIKTKVRFPVKNIPEDIVKYTWPSPTIDSDNRDIIRLANSIAEGESDLFVVAHKLAEWTKNNVEYNLSPSTVSVSKPASWVLANREGVCDELTNLFIALSRSLGIPARFIAGIAYSDSELFVDKWGPHGWGEVYFPGYGWVDYDVTFGEFGFIDPTHIKLKDSLDATQSSTKYSWLGRSVDIKTGQLDMTTKVNSYSDSFNDNIGIWAYPDKEEIGENSYNIINVRIRNNNDYYVSEELHLYKSKEVNIEGSNIKNIFLRPGEEKNVYWIISIGELEYGYIYTFPVMVQNTLNKTAHTSFMAGHAGAVFSKEDILSITNSGKEETEKKYSKDINLSCEVERVEFYVYEDNRLNCVLKNNGNVFFEDMEICFKEQCKKTELGIAQVKNILFKFNEEEPGKKEKEVKAKSKDALKTAIVKYTALDMPKIKITGLNYPKNVVYKEEYVVEFLMKKGSFSNPVKVEVTLDQAGYKKKWVIEEMLQDRKFVIDMKGKNMVAGENKFDIRVDFSDKLGNKYREEKSIGISLVNLNLVEKVLVLSNLLGREVLSNRGFMVFISIAGIIFILIFMVVFKRGNNERREES